jgi:hypothetical protein
VTNFGIRVSIANLESKGFTLENPAFRTQTGWTFAVQGPGSALLASQVCDPHRQRHVYEAVRDLYGRYGDLRR